MKPVAKNLALSALALSLGLAGLELVARQFGRREPACNAGAYIEHDVTLGWRLRPGASVDCAAGEYRVQVQVSSQGLRDKERMQQPEPGVTRLLALGDSFVEGMGVSESAAVTRQLEARLRERGHRVEAINGGTMGYSTDQELLFYERSGRRFAASLVVLFFYFNDVFGNATTSSPLGRDVKPRFVEQDGSLVLTGVPVARSPYRRGQDGPIVPLSRSALFAWVGSRLMSPLPRVYDALAQVGLWNARPQTPPASAELAFLTEEPAQIRAGWTMTAALLRRLASDVRNDGARFAIVYTPTRFEVGDTSWKRTLAFYGWTEPGADRHRVATRLAELAAANDTPFLDLTAALRAAEVGVLAPTYYRIDHHWTARGHRVASDAVAGFLEAQRLVP